MTGSAEEKHLGHYDAHVAYSERRVVFEVLSDTGQIDEDLHASLLQHRTRTNAGNLKDLIDGSAHINYPAISQRPT